MSISDFSVNIIFSFDVLGTCKVLHRRERSTTLRKFTVRLQAMVVRQRKKRVCCYDLSEGLL
jgi:hypothetical protein